MTKWQRFIRRWNLPEAMLLNGLSTYTPALRRDPCSYCGKPAGRKRKTRTLDHIIPRSEGGTRGWINLTAACNVCNQKKGTKPLLHFLLEQHHG